MGAGQTARKRDEGQQDRKLYLRYVRRPFKQDRQRGQLRVHDAQREDNPHDVVGQRRGHRV